MRRGYYLRCLHSVVVLAFDKILESLFVGFAYVLTISSCLSIQISICWWYWSRLFRESTFGSNTSEITIRSFLGPDNVLRLWAFILLKDWLFLNLSFFGEEVNFLFVFKWIEILLLVLYFYWCADKSFLKEMLLLLLKSRLNLFWILRNYFLML